MATYDRAGTGCLVRPCTARLGGDRLLDSCKLGIVAALEREVYPLLKNWQIVEREHEGRQFRVFERGGTVLVCGGIGAEPARRATEAIVNFYHPALILSTGFAGGLDPTMKVGSIFTPGCVVDEKNGSRLAAGSGTGTLLTSSAIAGAEQKAKYLKDYGAAAIDMEAAAVARVAESHSTPFVAVKAISDEYDFDLPPMDRVVDRDGRFHTAAFAGFVVIRPWLWAKTARLARNSAKASQALCLWLEQYDRDLEKLENSGSGQHLINGKHLRPTVP